MANKKLPAEAGKRIREFCRGPITIRPHWVVFGSRLGLRYDIGMIGDQRDPSRGDADQTKEREPVTLDYANNRSKLWEMERIRRRSIGVHFLVGVSLLVLFILVLIIVKL